MSPTKDPGEDDPICLVPIRMYESERDAFRQACPHREMGSVARKLIMLWTQGKLTHRDLPKKTK